MSFNENARIDFRGLKLIKLDERPSDFFFFFFRIIKVKRVVAKRDSSMFRKT